MDIPDERIKNMIKWGKYGVDGLCDWIDSCIVDGGVSEALLEGKVSRLAKILGELWASFVEC
jgi:hypothetical protein